MIDQGLQLRYCDYEDCQSENKIIRTAQDIIAYHGGHPQRLKPLDDLRNELINHPLKNTKVNSHRADLYSLIDRETQNLITSFADVANDLNQQIKRLNKFLILSFASSSIVSVKELFDLYTSIIERNNAKIYQLQHLLPKLSISKKEIQDQHGQGRIVQDRVILIFKQMNERVQALKKVHFEDYTWSTNHKLESNIISGCTVTSVDDSWNMILIEPHFTLTDINKVQLKVTKLSTLFVSLCDVNIALNLQSTWDYRHNEGDGTYTHQQNGGILSHHQESPNQKNGQILAFTFQEGDILELEWNGPLRQFITSRPLTNSRYVQNVKFDENSQIHFGVQMHGSTVVDIIQ